MIDSNGTIIEQLSGVSKEVSSTLSTYVVSNSELIEIFNDINQLLKGSPFSKIVVLEATTNLRFKVQQDMYYIGEPKTCRKVSKDNNPVYTGFVFTPISPLLDKDKEATIHVTENSVVIESGTLALTLRGEITENPLLMLPDKRSANIEVNKALLISSLKKLNKLSPVYKQYVKDIEVTLEESKLKLRLPNFCADISSSDLELNFMTNRIPFLIQFADGKGDQFYTNKDGWCVIRKDCAVLYISTKKVDKSEISKYMEDCQKLGQYNLGGIVSAAKEMNRFSTFSNITLGLNEYGVRLALSDNELSLSIDTSNELGKTVDTFDLPISTLNALLNTVGVPTIHISKKGNLREIVADGVDILLSV